MKRLLSILGAIIFCVLLAFGLSIWLDIGWLNEPKPFLLSLGPWTSLAILGLLGLDIVLPIPGSVVMILSGHLYGALIGASLSFLGMMLSSSVGYVLGYLSRSRVFHSDTSSPRARRFMEQWGDLAVLLSRPVPVLSESVVILAGFERLSFKKVMAYCALGWLPTCIAYAAIGAFSFSTESNVWGFLVVISLSLVLLTWKISRKRVSGLDIP